MELDLDSTPAKLYRWFYAKETMPKSLNIYFWELVLMWVLIIPFFLIRNIYNNYK